MIKIINMKGLFEAAKTNLPTIKFVDIQLSVWVETIKLGIHCLVFFLQEKIPIKE